MVCELLNIFLLGFLLLLYVTIELMLANMRTVISMPMATVCSGVNCFLLATILPGTLFLIVPVFSFIHFSVSCMYVVYSHTFFFTIVIHNGTMMLFYLSDHVK